MKLLKNTFFVCSLFIITAINALSVQDLIDNGECPSVTINFDGKQCLNLNHKNLTSLEGLHNVPNIESVQRLSLESNNLTQLPDKIFDQLEQLYQLSLSFNKLTQLPDNIFDRLKPLKLLYLSNNKLTQLPDNVFNQLQQLKELYLHKNKLTQLPEHIFDQLKQLKWLDLYDNKLTQLPSKVFDQLKQLEILYLSNNQLTQLPDKIFDQLKQLKVINLFNNYLCLKDIKTLIRNLNIINLDYEIQHDPRDLAREKLRTKELLPMRHSTRNIAHILQARETGGFSIHVLPRQSEQKRLTHSMQQLTLKSE